MKSNGFSNLQKEELAEIVGSVVDKKLDDRFKTELKPIHKKLDKLQNTLSTAIRFFDKITLNHDIRITKIENHLQLHVN